MFLHPWAIGIGVVAAGLPVAIHFLTRPRPRRMALSTLRFVQDAVKQRRARHRLRDAVVLTLRTLAVLALAAAIARPDVGRQETANVSESAQAVRLVVLDTSLSMGAVHRGVRAFERARPLAARLLEYRNGLRANLILAGARPTAIFERASTNFSVLRDELAAASPRPEQLQVQAALNRAAEVLAQETSAGDGAESGTHREVVIISDFQRSNWAAADFSVIPEGVDIILESVAAEEPLPNLAVLRVASQGRAEAGREARVEVDVGNYSSTPRTVRVDLTMGGVGVQVSGLCGPYSQTTLTGDLLPRETGWQIGSARLLEVDDALPADDVRDFVFDVRPPPRYVLLTRQSEQQQPASSYFLERALVPDQAAPPKGDSGAARLSRMNPQQIDPDVLATAELIVLDHAGKLPAETLSQLADLLQRGRGLLYVAAEPIDATNLKLLGEAVGSGWKPPVEFVPPRAAQPRRNLFLAEMRRDQSPFAVFGDELTPLAAPLRFGGGLDSRRVEGALPEDILAQFNDHSACLVSMTSGAGAVVVLNADLSASNLPTSPAFVPLMGELVQRLLGRSAAVNTFPCGEPWAVSLPPQVSSVQDLQVVGPHADAATGELLPDSTGVLWRSTAAGPPGVYRVQQRDETVFALATAAAAVESDLRTLSADVFQERLAQGRRVQFHGVAQISEQKHDTWWTWLAMCSVALVLGELAALKYFRS